MVTFSPAAQKPLRKYKSNVPKASFKAFFELSVTSVAVPLNMGPYCI